MHLRSSRGTHNSSSNKHDAMCCVGAGEVIQLKAAPGHTFSTQELKAAVAKHKPAILFLVQGESSTGGRRSKAGCRQLGGGAAGVGECGRTTGQGQHAGSSSEQQLGC
jgi:hypothetical protein